MSLKPTAYRHVYRSLHDFSAGKRTTNVGLYGVGILEIYEFASRRPTKPSADYFRELD